MATFGNNNISLNAVRAVLGESTKSLWNLCNNPNINKWAKYSPKTNHGQNIPFTCSPVARQFDCAVWNYNPIAITEAKLGDFRQYNHNAIVPISGGFPTELYSNLNNVFSVATTPDEGDNINCASVYNTTNLYFGVAIRRVNDTSKMIWCTADTKGSNSVSVNLNGYAAYFGNGAQVEAVLFYSTAKKALADPDVMSDFYSIKADAQVVDRKQFTIKSYSPPTSYETFRLIVNPNGGFWAYDEVRFDDLGIELKGKVQASYRYRIRIVTPDDRYYTDYSMLRDVTVNAGETKVVVSTGMIDLRFYGDYNMVFVQCLDLKNNNKLVAEIPVMRMIDM